MEIRDLPDEEWRKCVLLNDLYLVSNMGRVKRLAYKQANPSTGILYFYKERLLNPKPDSSGYIRICFILKGVKQYYTVHRLVAFAFLGFPTKEQPWVNHKNGVKHDNCLSNLEWSSPKENNDHALKTGLKSKTFMQTLSKEAATEILLAKRRKNFRKDLAEKHNVSIGCIVQIRKANSNNWRQLKEELGYQGVGKPLIPKFNNYSAICDCKVNKTESSL